MIRSERPPATIPFFRRAPITRRILSLAAAFALVAPAAPAAAQFGLAAGPSIAELFGSDVQSSRSRSGLTAGRSYTFLRLGPVSVIGELFCAPKGAAETQLLVESPEFFEEVGLDYGEIPLLAHFGFAVPGTGEALRASVTGGPAFAWRLNCSVRVSESGRTTRSVST